MKKKNDKLLYRIKNPYKSRKITKEKKENEEENEKKKKALDFFLSQFIHIALLLLY